MRIIGHYQVEEEPIGRGGMGQVLRGFSPTGLKVAIKEILPQYVSDPQYRDRIEKEINFLRQFDHDNVVRVYDHFELDGKLYIVMELVDGENIEEYIASHGPMPWKEALGYMERLLDTMEYVHSKNVIHRDIKPGNVMLRPSKTDPGKIDVCLLDFGVAKDASTPSGNSGGTVLGSIIGTDGYMSPEQAAGMTINYRADIYALGCVLYFMLTGRHAYEKLDSDFETQYAILNEPFPRIADKRPGVPEAVQAVLDKATDRNMLNRFQSCGEFRDRVARLVRGGTEIGSRSAARNISVTIGRENCDILVDPNNYRVSRHHATVTRKQFTGGIYYVYTDESSNGTLINNMVYSKGMSYNIQRGIYPEILLAGDPSCQLDIAAVAQRLDAMAEEAQKEDFAGDSTLIDAGYQGGNGYDRQNSRNEEDLRYDPTPKIAGSYSNADNIVDAVKNVFRRYVDFRGRSGRGEYWWWVLCNIIIITAIQAVYIAMDFEQAVLIAVGVWNLATLLPSIAVSVRRLHDTGRGWLQYILCTIFSIFLVPAIMLLVWLCKPGEPMNNEYGPGEGQIPRRR